MTHVSRGVFTSGDAEIAYLDATPDSREGAPIVLVHGFASTKETNWQAPGWIDTLTRAGRRAIALDNRGHGESTRFYDPARYHSALMADDVRALMDHLGLPRADLMGYSMGARIAAFLALAHPDRVHTLILGGLGIGLVDGVGEPARIAVALEAPSITEVRDPTGYAFRAFAQQTKSDLKALAACIRGARQTLSRDEVARIATPTLIAIGTKDSVGGSGQALAALMPNAVALDIPGRDHMLAVGDKVFKAGVLAFLEDHP